MDPSKIIELIKACNEGDSIIWDEPNGEVYKIKVEKKYPKDWTPSKEQLKTLKKERKELADKRLKRNKESAKKVRAALSRLRSRNC